MPDHRHYTPAPPSSTRSCAIRRSVAAGRGFTVDDVLAELMQLGHVVIDVRDESPTRATAPVRLPPGAERRRRDLRRGPHDHRRRPALPDRGRDDIAVEVARGLDGLADLLGDASPQVELARVRAATGHVRRAAARAQPHRLGDRHPRREPGREAGGERVPGAVGVDARAGQRLGLPGPAPGLAVPAAARRAERRDDGARRRVERRRVDLLVLVVAGVHEHVDRHARLDQRLVGARRRDDDLARRAARSAPASPPVK